MLRELIDTAVLEDFLSGIARAGGLRASAYSPRGRLIATSTGTPEDDPANPVLRALPQRLEMMKLLPAHEPPAAVAIVPHGRRCTLVVPIHIRRQVAGFVALGAFRNDRPGGRAGAVPDADGAAPAGTPLLERRGDALPVILARWASRMLAAWCLNEARLDAAAEELALLGDIGELLSGEQDLQTVLDHIVEQTTRVMNVQYCSLRLYDAESGKLTVRAGCNVLERYDDERTILRRDNPIDDEALQGRIVYIEDASRDPRIRFDEAQRLGIVSGLVTGMMYRGEAVGVLRVYSNHYRRFRTQQRKLLRAVAAQAAVAVVNSRLFDERLRSALLQRELRTAGAVQERMMRLPPPPHPRVDSARVFEPSFAVGGDFCDLFCLGDGRLAAVVGDVVGHGVPAALLMASVRGALRAASEYCANLAQLAAHINEHVLRVTTSSEFVTMLLLAVDEEARTLHFVNAGHEPLMLLREGRITQPPEANLVLGIDGEEMYKEHTLSLRPGDFVLLYTDGIVEAMNVGGEVFGRSRLCKSLSANATAETSPELALRSILWEVRRFVGMENQADDMTMVGLRIRDETP